MDTLTALWPRFATVIESAVAGLGGAWSFHELPPDATRPPAVWIERDAQGLSFDHADLGEVTFVVVAAFAAQPAQPTMAAELALIDAVTAATAPTAANGLHRTGLRTDPPGRLEIGGVGYCRRRPRHRRLLTLLKRRSQHARRLTHHNDRREFDPHP